MKLEIGKKYNTQGGFVVEIIKKTKNGTFEAIAERGLFYYNKDGSNAGFCSVFHNWEIISES